jgi:hypothetical protein
LFYYSFFMAKAELKTKVTNENPRNYLNTLPDRQQREDCFKILDMMKRATGDEPRMWGPSIIGFGHQVLTYDTGRELDWMVTGFAPRKANITLYALKDSVEQSHLLKALGKHKTGKGCLYIKRLSDIDTTVLQKLIAAYVKLPDSAEGE